MDQNQPSIAPSQEADGFSLADLRLILSRRYLLIGSVSVLGLLVGVFFGIQPRKYVAEGSIRIEPGMSSMYRTSPIALAAGDGYDKIASESAILQSRTLYVELARELDLANSPAFWGGAVKKHKSMDDPKTREQVVRAMRSKIKVDHAPKDEILHISCVTTSPELSAKITNNLINDYIEYLTQMKFRATQHTANWLVGQLDDLKHEIERDQSTLTDLQGKLGIVGLGDKAASTTLALESLDSVTKAADEATIQRIVAEAKYRHLSETDPTLIETESQPLAGVGSQTMSLLQTLRISQSTAASNYARLSSQFGPNYPDVRDAKAQLDSINRQVTAEQARIINQAKLAFQAASSNEQMTQAQVAKERSEAFRFHDDMEHYQILLHDYESHRTLYEGLVQRLREAGITSGMESGEVDIVDLADLPGIPNPPGPITLILGGIFAGLFVGAFFALLIELTSGRIVSVEQAESSTGFAALGILPHILVGKGDKAAVQDATSSVKIEVLANPKSRYSEAVQTLRTSVLFSSPRGVPKLMLVTSSVPAEGKSTVSRNLAAALAQHHKKVLLVDCDLRRGTLAARVFDNLNLPGLSNILTLQAATKDVIRKVPGSESLFLLPSGPRPPEPGILLSSPELEVLLAKLSDEYDHVILDCPPILGISDTLNLARIVDAGIFVVREGMTQAGTLRRAVSVMRSTNFIPMGLVMNDVDLRAASYGYGYGSAYYQYY